MNDPMFASFGDKHQARVEMFRKRKIQVGTFDKVQKREKSLY